MQTKKSKWVSGRIALMGAMFIALAVTGRAQTLVINEVMADNKSVDDRNNITDYIELKNISASSITLTDYRLSDTTNNPVKYRFPAGLPPLGPGERLVVFADDDTNSAGIHIRFGLSADGEDLRLYSPSGAQLDKVVFGLQLTDFSIGRVPDGTGPWTLNVGTPGDANQAQPLGTTADLFINEWMALWGDDPINNPEDDWLELYNGQNLPVAIGGLFLTDSTAAIPAGDDEFELTPLSFIGPLGFIRFWADGTDKVDVLGAGADHLTFRLSSSNGETLTLYEADRFTDIDTVTFGSQAANQSEGRLPDGSSTILRFPVDRATPGESNFPRITNVVFNEVLSHSDPPYEDAIELYNPTASPVDISNYWLSDDQTEPKKYRIPAGTIIPAGGYKVFYEFLHFNTSGTGMTPDFSLNSYLGEEVNLFSANASGDLTGFRLRETFKAAANDPPAPDSFGRHVNSDGDVDFVIMSAPSFGVSNPSTLAEFQMGTGMANPGPKIGPVVISEIMYHPPDIVVLTNTVDNSLDEYIELRNITTSPVPLFDPIYTTNAWRLVDAVDFVFPTAAGRRITLPPGGTVIVVNFDPAVDTAVLAAFRQKYRVGANVPIVGPYGGKLNNSEDSVELERPDRPQGPGPVVGFTPYVRVDRVNYTDDPPWPTDLPDGGGYALERYPVESYGNDPIHWRASAPTPGGETIPIMSYTLGATSMTIQFEGKAGAGYSVLIQDELRTPPGWTKLRDVPAEATTGVRTVVDTSIPAFGSRFYEVVTPQQ